MEPEIQQATAGFECGRGHESGSAVASAAGKSKAMGPLQKPLKKQSPANTLILPQ
jgi:hypothetical protein